MFKGDTQKGKKRLSMPFIITEIYVIKYVIKKVVFMRILTILLTCMPLLLYSQQLRGVCKGTVVDADVGMPIPAAMVKIEAGDTANLTNRRNVFQYRYNPATGEIITEYQSGILPVGEFRVYF